MTSGFRTGECHWRRPCFTYHPILGWWYIPRLRARIPHDGDFYLLRTNSRGMRSDRDYTLERPRGRRRIVLLGDSYSAGDGVSNGERFSDRLEQRFPHLDVLNFGLPNSGTDQQVLVYETMAREFEVDAFIFAICVENVGRNILTCRPSWDPAEQEVVHRAKPYFTLSDGELDLHNQPVPRDKLSEKNLGDWVRQTPGGLNMPSTTNTYHLYHYEEGRPWQLMRRILERFLAQTGGKPVFILPLPMYDFVLGDEPPVYLERFRSLADPARKRYVVNILPAILRLPLDDRRRCRTPNDPHYTAFAHQLVAHELTDALSQYHSELLTGATLT